MRVWAAALAAFGLVMVGVAQAAADHPVTAGTVGVTIADEWARVVPAQESAANGAEPRTLLVVGTHGVSARASGCQVASYRIPAEGAAVVVLGWRGTAPAGLPRDRSQLLALRLRRPLFECFEGRGAVAQIVIRGRAYQVNVMVGDHATRDTVADALAVARSFAAVSSS